MGPEEQERSIAGAVPPSPSMTPGNVAVAGQAPVAPGPDTWRERQRVPNDRSLVGAAALGGKIYVVGGNDYQGTLTGREVDAYDPATNSWAARAPMLTARTSPRALALDGKLYVLGGRDGNGQLDTMEVYDPATNSWAARAPPNPGAWFAAVAALGRIYLAAPGGVKIYDPAADAWTERPLPMAPVSAAAVGSEIYVFGSGCVARYDPAKDTLAVTGLLHGSIPVGTWEPVAAASGRIYFIPGGHHRPPTLEYDPQRDAWRFASDALNLYDFAIADAGAEIFTFGGTTEAGRHEGYAWQYTPPTPAGPKTVPVGGAPFGVLATRDAIWVASTAESCLVKLRHDDGLVLGKFPVGKNPRGDIAEAFGHLWVTNTGDGTVSKVRQSDGAVVLTVAVGSLPHGVAAQQVGSAPFSVWVANYGSNTVTRLRETDGAVLGTFPVGVHPTGIAIANDVLWVATSTGITKLRESDGANLGTFTPVSDPYGIVAIEHTYGRYVWFANHGSNTVTKLDPATGNALGTFTVGQAPVAIAHCRADLAAVGKDLDAVTEADGALFVSNAGSGTVTKLRLSDGALLATLQVGGKPYGVAVETVGYGAYLHAWVADYAGGIARRF